MMDGEPIHMGGAHTESILGFKDREIAGVGSFFKHSRKQKNGRYVPGVPKECRDFLGQSCKFWNLYLRQAIFASFRFEQYSRPCWIENDQPVDVFLADFCRCRFRLRLCCCGTLHRLAVSSLCVLADLTLPSYVLL